MANILFIEPYYDGSHRAFADGWQKQSRHTIRLLTLPARKWKWRMRGAAVYFSQCLPEFAPDAVIASDFLDLAAFGTLTKTELENVPLVAYFHENQLTYPVQDEAERDYQFGFTNITSCLAADRVFFNTHFHLDSFLDAVDELLGKMPDHRPENVTSAIRENADVIPVGVNLNEIDRLRSESNKSPGPLRIVWNHRWEFDKGPGRFFLAMQKLNEQRADFELCVMGETFRDQPEIFEKARRELDEHIVHFGFAETREGYLRNLLDGDVVVSTARHEFFGIAVVEAIYAGCVPLLPHRLSYPELIPEPLHARHLYKSDEELVEQLARWAEKPETIRSLNLKDSVKDYGWDSVAPILDSAIENVIS
ncbi:MAG: DUF3524 domain-containing protein [Planctomycetes bacterium]|nr:DUF3524 domain-containing protein [Planctomycetota bacterium]